ncbi:MAG: efflux RND transporter periplasmic adaptor subunit [Acidobacteriota bacterium]|nr:efflux RND transporter periplasmic adaptor subunit [Acidobacteriota bacterium]
MIRPLLLLLLLCSPLGCRPQAPPPDPPGPKVQGDGIVFPEGAAGLSSLSVAPVEKVAGATLRATGRLAWNEEVTARVYSPVGGRVARMIANLEQRVGKGAPLAAIESPDFGQAQADANRAATDLTAAERTLGRARSLYEHGAAAKKDLEGAEADQLRSKVESERAKTRLTLLGGRLGAVDQHFVLRSPIAGTVVDRIINPGLEVRTDGQTALYTISDPGRLWVFLDVTEKDLAHVRPGMPLSLRSAAYPDRVFAGRTDVVGDTLDPATRTVKARGSLLNPDRLLKAEMYVDVEIADPAEQPGLAVPTAAVVADGPRRFVFVEVGKGRFLRRPVTAGPERSGRTQIAEGLSSGQRVVVDGSLLLQSLLTGG